jgi:thiamine biosynthesis protein ThiS
MEVVVNGEARVVAADATVALLISELGLDPHRVAVERNRDIVPRAEYAQVALEQGDRLEIVTFVGGG